MSAQTPANPYAQNLDKCAANYQPLTPLTLLQRAAAVYPAHTAVVHGTLRQSYAEFYARCRRLASALSQRGIGVGDTVTVMLAEYAGHAGGALRGADDRGGAAFAEHAAGCGGAGLPARPCRQRRS